MQGLYVKQIFLSGELRFASSSEEASKREKKEQTMKAIISGVARALGAGIPRIAMAGWAVTKFTVRTVVILLVVMIALILRISRDIFITTYPR